MAEDIDAAMPASILLSIIIEAALACYANFLYFRRAALRSQSARVAFPSDFAKVVSERGGTNLWYGLAWGAGFVFSQFIVGVIFGITLLNQGSAVSRNAQPTPAQQNDRYFSAERFGRWRGN